MNKIITITDLKQFKDLGGEKVDDKKINPIIEQTQITDLKESLGTAFYFDVMNNLNNSEYQDLLSGSSFTYLGVDYYHDGLKALTADYFMARYLLALNTNITPFGATTKSSNESEPADRNTLKDLATQQLQLAGARLEIIKLYLASKTTDFPIYIQNNDTNSSSGNIGVNTFRIRKI